MAGCHPYDERVHDQFTGRFGAQDHRASTLGGETDEFVFTEWSGLDVRAHFNCDFIHYFGAYKLIDHYVAMLFQRGADFFDGGGI
ncbi:hypothetical protein D3C75_963590 [compost metagenome]